MNHEDHDIDALLRGDVERQLAGFDWARLGREIDARVTAAAVRHSAWARYGRWAAMAAGIMLATGVLTYTLTSSTRPGVATVAIESARPVGTAQVFFEPEEKPARCEVTILPSDKPQQQKSQMQASWCIVVARDLPAEKHRNSRDASDALCLF